jgi:DNA (cytosine-5)-methyltransferase 1
VLKVIELFAGLGTITQALKELGVEHEIVATSEIDKFAVQSYTAIHGAPNNLGDITKIKELPAADLWFYGFCCQDISVAGKLAGIKEGTRSGLLLEVERLLRTAADNDTLPKYLILENVKNLVGARFKPDFDRWLCFLETLGYVNYWKVLNTRDYCIPQNRERVFCVSIRGEHEPFRFPEKRALRLRLKDMLDETVDERFYLSERALKSLGHSSYNQEKFRMQPLDGVHRTCCSRDYKSPTVVPVQGCKQIGSLSGGKWDKMNEMSRRVYGTDGASPTVHCAGGGNTEIKIVTEGSYAPSGHNAARVVNGNGLAPTVMENHGTVSAVKIVDDTYPNREPREHTDVSPAIRAARYGFKVVSGQFRPIDRDYNKHGGERVEQFEARKDDVSNALLTGAMKNCVQIVAMRGRPDGNGDYEQRLEPNGNGTSNTLTSVQKDNLVLEPQVLKTQRTDYGKATRKAYEAGEIPGDRKAMREEVPRTDGLANTLTLQQRDNFLVEPPPYITPEDAEASKCVRAGGHGLHYGHTWDVIRVREATQKGYAEAATGDGVNTTYPSSDTKRGRVGKGVSNTLTCGDGMGVVTNEVRIRKLTPWECLRLQGWRDHEINKIRAAGVSAAQMYRQAGNGITATVLIAIFGELFGVPYAEILDTWRWQDE